MILDNLDTMFGMHMRTHVTGFGYWALVSSSFNDDELESSRDATQNNGLRNLQQDPVNGPLNLSI